MSKAVALFEESEWELVLDAHDEDMRSGIRWVLGCPRRKRQIGKHKFLKRHVFNLPLSSVLPGGPARLTGTWRRAWRAGSRSEADSPRDGPWVDMGHMGACRRAWTCPGVHGRTCGSMQGHLVTCWGI